MEEEYFLMPFSFLDAYHQQIAPLPGYTPCIPRTAEEFVSLNKQGV